MNNDSYWTTRRTIRRYQQRDVSPSLIDNIIEQASHAPTTGNMQLYTVIVTRDPEIRRALYPAHFSQPAATGAPLLLTFCADFNRFSRWCRLNDARPGYDNFQSFVAAMLDVTIFAQQFVTIAEQQGLGCCYLGTTTYNAPEIARVLELPDLVVPVITLSVGYPDESGEITERLPLDAIRHHDKYHAPDDNTLQRLYADKEALPANRRFVAENGKQTLAQVFTDIRYTKANNEHFSQTLLDYLCQTGFLDR